MFQISSTVDNGYLLQDVKLAVNRTLSAFGVLFSRPPYAQRYSQHPQLHAVSRMLLEKMHSGALHWRSIILAHAWFVTLMPISTDLDLTREVVKLQLHHALQNEMLFVKVRLIFVCLNG